MARAAAVDAFIWFLKVEGAGGTVGIPGTSTYEGQNDAFEIKDFSFGVENPTTIGSATGGAGAGKIKFNEFTIKKTTDQASPLFFKSCASGTHYKNATLTMRKSGREQKDFLKITLQDVLISSYQQSGIKPPPAPDPGPVDIAVLANADTIGGPSNIAGPADDLTDSVGFNFANATMVSDPRTISVRPAAIGQAVFNAKTGDVNLTETDGNTFTVGTQQDAQTDGLLVMRYLFAYDVGNLTDVLNAPFNTGKLTLTVNEVRPVSGPGDDLGEFHEVPSPDLHFDVYMYEPSGPQVTLEDLTRPGKRIGSLHVQPRKDPASLELDLGPLLGDNGLFGLRLQLRGKPISTPDDPQVPPDEARFDEATSDDDEPNETGKGQNRSATFTMNVELDTQGE